MEVLTGKSTRHIYKWVFFPLFNKILRDFPISGSNPWIILQHPMTRTRQRHHMTVRCPSKAWVASTGLYLGCFLHGALHRESLLLFIKTSQKKLLSRKSGMTKVDHGCVCVWPYIYIWVIYVCLVYQSNIRWTPILDGYGVFNWWEGLTMIVTTSSCSHTSVPPVLKSLELQFLVCYGSYPLVI